MSRLEERNCRAFGPPLHDVRGSIDADRVVTIWIDQVGKAVNTLTEKMLADLSAMVEAVAVESPAAVLFASAKTRTFVAGADLFEIRTMDRRHLEKYLETGQQLFDRIANLPFPTAAAIGGDCLGGGLELAMACRYRVAADPGSINIGLPEVKLGLVPGWGGTVRLTRLIGLENALPLLLAGRTLPPDRVLKAGIVDEIHRPEQLPAAAKRLALSGEDSRNLACTRQEASDRSNAGKLLAAARKKILEQTGFNYPAPLRLIDVLAAGYERGSAVGFEEERKALADLIETEAARNLMRLFFLRQGAKKEIWKKISGKPADVKYAGVLGGGTMGAGIVHALAGAGIKVRLIETDDNAVIRAKVRVKKLFEDDLTGGRASSTAIDEMLGRVTHGTLWADLEQMDIVIEAIVEKMPLKQEIFARLDGATRPDCVLATNTSSLSVTQMADACAHPERVVGLHFFNPVPKMPLVEVVRTSRSDERSLATAIALAARLGKTPVLVNDSPGFLVNRVLIPYLAEAIVLASEGTSIAAIDSALRAWGMPMGPFELIDEIGLDITDHIIKSLSAQLAGRLPVSEILSRAIDRGRLGKKSGSGFYVYANKQKGDKAPVNPELAEMISGGAVGTDRSTSAAPLDPDAISWRLVLPMVNEAGRVLEERVVDSTDAIDLATVLGAGLAPFRGGLAQFISSVGIPPLLGRLNPLSAKYGARFVPADLFVKLADKGLPLASFSKM